MTPEVAEPAEAIKEKHKESKMLERTKNNLFTYTFKNGEYEVEKIDCSSEDDFDGGGNVVENTLIVYEDEKEIVKLSYFSVSFDYHLKNDDNNERDFYVEECCDDSVNNLFLEDQLLMPSSSSRNIKSVKRKFNRFMKKGQSNVIRSSKTTNLNQFKPHPVEIANFNSSSRIKTEIEDEMHTNKFISKRKKFKSFKLRNFEDNQDQSMVSNEEDNTARSPAAKRIKTLIPRKLIKKEQDTNMESELSPNRLKNRLHLLNPVDVENIYKEELEALNKLVELQVNFQQQNVDNNIERESRKQLMYKKLLSQANDNNRSRPEVKKAKPFARIDTNNYSEYIDVSSEDLNLKLKVYNCSLCSYHTQYEAHLNDHMRSVHVSKPFKCSYCHLSFTRKSNLNIHLRLHTGDRPHKCEECSYRSNDAKTLKIHTMTHTSEMKIKCPLCNFRCKLKQYLRKHMRNHIDEKRYRCPNCPYRCHDKHALLSHMQSHLTSSMKTHRCPYCTYGCNNKRILLTHVRTHTIECPYRCTVCEYTTDNLTRLNSHLEKHKTMLEGSSHIKDLLNQS